MAIFHMSFSNISAGKGRSAIAGASYRSGEKLFDQKEGRSYFYARSVMPESFILTSKNDKNPSYCSKYVYLAYWWGTSHKGMKGGLMWVFPFSMTNVFSGTYKPSYIYKLTTK